MGDKERKDDFNLVGKEFGDYFLYEIAKGYGPKFVWGINNISLGNQSKESRVKGFKDKLLNARLFHKGMHFQCEDGPSSFVEINSETIRT